MAGKSGKGTGGVTAADLGITDPETLASGGTANGGRSGGNTGDGTGSDGNGSDGNGSDGNGGTGGDEYARNADGSVKRNKDGSPRRKRGRKPGSGNRTAQKAAGNFSIGGIESVLISIHAMLAGLTSSPELNLEKDESKNLAESIAQVQSFYDFSANAKTIAWVNLIFVCGSIYGPKIWLIRERKKEEKPTKKKGADLHVIPTQQIPGVPEGAHVETP